MPITTKQLVSEVRKFIIDAIRMDLPVRYDDEDMPDDYPLRDGDMWRIVVDVETGKIRNWPAGVKVPKLNLTMKVCDEGRYHLIGVDGNVIASINQDYVPGCIPGEYGDYVHFDLDGKGNITNWKFDASNLDSFFVKN